MKERSGTKGRLRAADALYDGWASVCRRLPRVNRGRKHRRTGEIVFYCAVLALPVAQFLIMYVGVNFNSFLLAFREYAVNTDGTATVSWVGFDNFSRFIEEVFRQPLMGRRFINSLIVYGVNLFVGTALAILFSYYVYKRYRGTEFFRVMLVLPSVCSSVVLVLLYTYAIDRAIPELFGVKSPLSGRPLQTFVFVMLYNVLMGFGTGVLMYSNAMSRIPDSLVEYARLEGATPVKEFFTVTFPLVYPTIETFLIIGVANIFIDQANLFTFFTDDAEPAVQTVGYFLFQQVFTDRSTMSSYPYASAAGLSLTAVTIPVVMLARFLLDKLDKGAEF